MERPPPGIYDDPAEPGRQRYWDGRVWKEQLATPSGAPAASPSSSNSAAEFGTAFPSVVESVASWEIARRHAYRSLLRAALSAVFLLTAAGVCTYVVVGGLAQPKEGFYTDVLAPAAAALSSLALCRRVGGYALAARAAILRGPTRLQCHAGGVIVRGAAYAGRGELPQGLKVAAGSGPCFAVSPGVALGPGRTGKERRARRSRADDRLLYGGLALLASDGTEVVTPLRGNRAREARLERSLVSVVNYPLPGGCIMPESGWVLV